MLKMETPKYLVEIVDDEWLYLEDRDPETGEVIDCCHLSWEDLTDTDQEFCSAARNVASGFVQSLLKILTREGDCCKN